MPDYNNTCIYKICCKDTDITDIYVGHTVNFKNRIGCHMYCCISEKNNRYFDYVYHFIRENGGWDNWEMIKLYDYPCLSKKEALIEERKCYDKLGAKLNTKKPYQTKEELNAHVKWYKSQPKALAYAKSDKRKKLKYENNQTQKRKDYNKQYIIDNKEKLSEKRKIKVSCEHCGKKMVTTSIKRHINGGWCKSFNQKQ